MKKIISLCLTLCLLLLALPVQAQAAKINYKAFTLVTGFTETLEIDNYAGKVTWKSSKPRVAKVSEDGVVTAKAKGKAIGRHKTTIADIPNVFLKHYDKYKKGELSKMDLSRLCELSYPTVYKYISILEG